MYSNKYKNQKVVLDGIKFDSRKEARRYASLKVLENMGTISNLKLQVPFVLIEKSENGRAIKYVADFTYYDDTGKLIVEDTKGFKTDVYKLKKRMLKEKFNIDILET